MTQGMKLDFATMTWEEMAEVVRDLWIEMKRRNPIGINAYMPPLYASYAALDQIAKAERENPTSEVGPGIKKTKRKR